MADPRLTQSFLGIGTLNVTYETDHAEGSPTIVYNSAQVNGSAQAGLAVTLMGSGNTNRIQLAGDAEKIVGKLISVDANNRANVQVRGYCTLPGGTSATLTPGKAFVGDLLVSAEGYIREVAEGTAAELAVQTGFIQDASTTTAVVVFLG